MPLGRTARTRGREGEPEFGGDEASTDRPASCGADPLMDLALVEGRVMTDAGLCDGLAVGLAGDRIGFVGPPADLPPDVPRLNLGGQSLLPGFIDVQVNGGGGVLFNDTPTPEGVAAIGRAHRRFGTTGFLPTLISDRLDVVRRGLRAVSEAMDKGTPGLLGIHLEGPFLNPARKGIHDGAVLRRLDAELLPELTSLTRGRTLVTLAPELQPPGTIEALVAAGVIVSAGHTDATYEEMRQALARGVTGVTHLFNAMSPLGHRRPGVVGAALEDQTAWCGLIVDGHHVSPVVLRLALRCRPLSRFLLVTDAMPCVGSDQTGFTLNGRPIFVRDGTCVDAEGTLAGSNLDMAGAVRNAVRALGLTLAEASRLASGNPAAFLGLDHELGRIAPGYRADLVLLDDALQVTQTWIAGQTPLEGDLHA